MKPSEKNVYLYYAHLDKQLVQTGQSVKKGDILGLVGNTGNARYTPSHLHFGVYTYKGAIDPLPFVNRTVKTAPAISQKNLKAPLKLTKSQKTADGLVLRPSTILKPLAITAKGYFAELENGEVIEVGFDSVKTILSSSKEKGAMATRPSPNSKAS